MRKPFPLEKEALRYWNAHAKLLETRGILSPTSRFSFGLLCQTWGLIQDLVDLQKVKRSEVLDPFREMTQLGKLHGLYQNLAKQFGLLPAAAKRDKLDEAPPDTTDEFGL